MIGSFCGPTFCKDVDRMMDAAANTGHPTDGEGSHRRAFNTESMQGEETTIRANMASEKDFLNLLYLEATRFDFCSLSCSANPSKRRGFDSQILTQRQTSDKRTVQKQPIPSGRWISCILRGHGSCRSLCPIRPGRTGGR